MRSRKTGETFASYLISGEIGVRLQELKSISTIESFQTKWKHYVKPTRITICFICQRPGHGARNRYFSPRCVKCTEPHATKDCTIVKNPGSKVTYCNCNGPHTANYRGCPIVVSYLQSKTPTNSATQNSHTNPTKNLAKFNAMQHNFPALPKQQSPQAEHSNQNLNYKQALINNNRMSVRVI